MSAELDGRTNNARLTGTTAGLTFWSGRIAGLVEPVIPSLADSLRDKAKWLTVGPVAAAAPWTALIVGFLTPLLWPGIRIVYSESLPFMILLTAIAFLSGQLGAPLWLGYIAGDLLTNSKGISLGSLGGRIIAYFLLAMLAWRIPILARQLAGRRVLPNIQSRSLGSSLGFPVLAGALVFFWCQAMIVLIRPVFVWGGGSPTREAIAPVQEQWVWLVTTAAISGLVRLVLEDRSVAPPELRASVRLEEPRSRGQLWEKLPSAIRILLAALMLAFVLGGTLTGWWDFLVVVAILALLGALRVGLVWKAFAQRMQRMNDVPVLLRVLVAVAGGFYMAVFFAYLFWSSNSLRPIMLGAVVTTAIFYLAFPPVAEEGA
jgi:hypothetical protein